MRPVKAKIGENWKDSFSGGYLSFRGTKVSFHFQWDILRRPQSIEQRDVNVYGQSSSSCTRSIEQRDVKVSSQLSNSCTQSIDQRYCRHCTCGVATISTLLQILGLLCKRDLWKRRYSAKETCHCKEPTNRSHPIVYRILIVPYWLYIQGGVESQDASSLLVISHKRALWLVALLRKETCNFRYSMHIRHPEVN